MVKLRDARYCNLKLFLIYLVIYGHLIEPGIYDTPVLMTQYRWIYLVHMPLFAFLSGLFLKDCKTCLHQLKRMLPLYILLQAAAMLLGHSTGSLFTPYWHLWYLLSCSAWTGLGWLWFRFGKGRGKWLILAGSLLMGCAAGYISAIGRPYSLSRTLVFLPYFWMGLILDPNLPWYRRKPVGLAALGIAIALMARGGNQLSVVFLYQAAPYAAFGYSFVHRLTCYLLGALLCLFLLTCTPAKRYPFTRAGADTMPAYLIHAPVVLFLRTLDIPWTAYPLTVILFLYAVYKIPQWYSGMYGIVPFERRERQWPHFKRSMKNTHSRSIGSCSPFPAIRIWPKSFCRRPSIRPSSTSTASRDGAAFIAGCARSEKTHGSKSAAEISGTALSAGTT